MRDCDACVVVVEGFSDAKVADAALTTSVQQHVGALDVTVNDTHLRVQVSIYFASIMNEVCQTP